MRLAPTVRQIAELRAAAHRDIDGIFDALPAMIDQANRPYRERPKTDLDDVDPGDERISPNEIRAKYQTSDPTGEAVVKANPARDWIGNVRRTIRQIHVLDAQANELIGPPICRHCRKDIWPDQRTKRTGEGLQHDRCAPFMRSLPVVSEAA